MPQTTARIFLAYRDAFDCYEVESSFEIDGEALRVWSDDRQCEISIEAGTRLERSDLAALRTAAMQLRDMGLDCDVVITTY
jgi:hypothetical protein